MGDLNPFLARIYALRHAIVDDGLIHGVPFHENDLRTLADRLLCEGSSFVMVTLPILGRALDLGLVTGQFNCPAHFSRKRDTCLPTFTGRVFQHIFAADGTLLVSPNTCSIYFLRQFLLFDGKLISEPTSVQKKQAIDGFVSRQASLLKRKVPRNHPVLERAKLLLSRTLKGLDLSDIHPGHGPGGVAEGYDRLVRWDFSSWPLRAERHYPYHLYGSQSFIALCATGAPLMVEKSITKCSLVPKDYKGPRLISSESAATQYLQQGQMKAIMRHIDIHPILSRSIKLRDQTHSQKMCRESVERGLGTLDLSNASDTVSAPLVWYLLSGVPKLRSQLFCTRSQSMRIDSTLVRITAFSPMGSAVCFPVETLVFWAITMASVRLVQSSWLNKPRISETASDICVFGDDIIAPLYAMSTIIGTLESVGCEPNAGKTCRYTPFRESCGSEWFRSTDVTITRNKRYNYDVTRKFINYPVLLDLQRKFFLQGLECTAALLCQWAREISPIATIAIGEYGFHVPDFPHWGTCVQRSTPWIARSYFQCLRSWNSHEQLHSPGGRATAFPSGMDLLIRSSAAYDSICCALGWYTTLDSGVPRRYNKAYQRSECRLPCLFQRTKQWDSILTDPDSLESRNGLRDHGFARPIDGDKSPSLVHLRIRSEYSRLLARVVGDSVDRIAIRNFMLKMAWSVIPTQSPVGD